MELAAVTVFLALHTGLVFKDAGRLSIRMIIAEGTVIRRINGESTILKTAEITTM
jgi:hypothetical protein